MPQPTLTPKNTAVRELGIAIHNAVREAPDNDSAVQLANDWNDWLLSNPQWTTFGLPWAYGALWGFWERYDAVRALVLRGGPPQGYLPPVEAVEPTVERVWRQYSAAQLDDLHRMLDAASSAVEDGARDAWRGAVQVRDALVSAATPEFVKDIGRGARIGWVLVGVGLVLYLVARVRKN